MGHEVSIFAPGIRGKTPDVPNIYRFHSMPLLGNKELRVVNPISKHLISLLKLDFDIIHSHTPFPMGLLALTQASAKNIPVIHTYHTLFTQYVHYLPMMENLGVSWAKRASKDYCNRCNAIITPSNAMKQELLSYGVKKPIEVIPTGIATNLIEKGNANLMRELNSIPPEVEIVSYVGRMAKEKNLEFLLRVFQKVAAQNKKPIQFMMIGDGPQRKHLQKLAHHLGIGAQVIFTGYVDKSTLASWYKVSDVFAFASTTETQGLVVLEAMSMGTPVVAIDAMGVSDIIRENLGGFASSANEEEFSKHILRLLSDDALRARKAIEARKQAETYSSQHMAEKLLGLYQKAIDNK